MWREYWLPSRKHRDALKYLPIMAAALLSLQPVAANTLSQGRLLSVSLAVADTGVKMPNENAKRRFNAWKKLITNQSHGNLMEKLRQTNNFFNQFYFEKDNDYQGITDYWKTPEEFIADGGGDCEDFAIAKYFTLLALDIPIDTLRITYVKSVKLNQAHMVLSYYPNPDAEPLVLDNLISEILPASKRPDLIPVYSFNGDGLWLAKQRGRDVPLGAASRLNKWQDLIERMKKEDKIP